VLASGLRGGPRRESGHPRGRGARHRRVSAGAFGARFAKAGLLYQVAEKFAHIDLHPDKVSNSQMGLVFEELIRKFAEISNETAGEHLTPREVIRLMVNLLFVEDDAVLSKPGVVRA
jgi:hypothetical protein